jgi:hypothetical protein
MAVPIDTTIESAYFVVSVQCLQIAALVTPSGQELSIATPGVEYHQFEAIRMFVVPKPAPGVWKVIAAGRGYFSAIVTARTDLQLDRVALSDADASRPTAALEARLRGAFRQASFHFVAGNSELIRIPSARFAGQVGRRRELQRPGQEATEGFPSRRDRRRRRRLSVPAHGEPTVNSQQSIVNSPRLLIAGDWRLATGDWRLLTVD